MHSNPPPNNPIPMQRERELRDSLSSAVKRCEELGRELSWLAVKAAAKGAKCEELQCELDKAAEEKLVRLSGDA
jgi:hypothetical protein